MATGEKAIKAGWTLIGVAGLLLLGGCASSSEQMPTSPPVSVNLALDKCQQIEPNLYKCPAVDKAICTPSSFALMWIVSTSGLRAASSCSAAGLTYRNIRRRKRIAARAAIWQFSIRVACDALSNLQEVRGPLAEKPLPALLLRAMPDGRSRHLGGRRVPGRGRNGRRQRASRRSQKAQASSLEPARVSSLGRRRWFN